MRTFFISMKLPADKDNFKFAILSDNFGEWKFNETNWENLHDNLQLTISIKVVQR